MKKIIIPAFAIFFLTACNSEITSESATETEETAMTNPNIKMDPICEMEYEPSFTEYSVNGTDTTWFCSEVCKGVYDKNPAKYNKG